MPVSSYAVGRLGLVLHSCWVVERVSLVMQAVARTGKQSDLNTSTAHSSSLRAMVVVGPHVKW